MMQILFKHNNLSLAVLIPSGVDEASHKIKCYQLAMIKAMMILIKP